MRQHPVDKYIYIYDTENGFRRDVWRVHNVSSQVSWRIQRTSTNRIHTDWSISTNWMRFCMHYYLIDFSINKMSCFTKYIVDHIKIWYYFVKIFNIKWYHRHCVTDMGSARQIWNVQQFKVAQLRGNAICIMRRWWQQSNGRIFVWYMNVWYLNVWYMNVIY